MAARFSSSNQCLFSLWSLLLITVFQFGMTDADKQWGYHTETDEVVPTDWTTISAACSGSRQSPIAINKSFVQPDNTLQAINFLHYDQYPRSNTWTVLDNGHSVQYNATFTDGTIPSLQAGGFNGSTYVLTQMHFHWGSDDARGSEHQVDGKQYPLELHIVHRKSTDSDAQAGADTTGLAVIAVLFEVVATGADTANAQMALLTDRFGQSVQPLVAVNLTLPTFTISQLLPVSRSYYRYMGSLTTPPCSEAVVWSVMKQPIKISEAQLVNFRKLHENADNFLVDNDRPLQALNGRVVISYDASSAGATILVTQNIIAAGLGLLLIRLILL